MAIARASRGELPGALRDGDLPVSGPGFQLRGASAGTRLWMGRLDDTRVAQPSRQRPEDLPSSSDSGRGRDVRDKVTFDGIPFRLAGAEALNASALPRSRPGVTSGCTISAATVRRHHTGCGHRSGFRAYRCPTRDLGQVWCRTACLVDGVGLLISMTLGSRWICGAVCVGTGTLPVAGPQPLPARLTFTTGAVPL
jgi:hypothetical protein